MSGQLDLERRIEAYFVDGPGRAPDHLLGQSLRAAVRERQVRRAWWPRVLDGGTRHSVALILAGVGAALVLSGFVLLRGGLVPLPGPTDSSVPGASPSPTATPTPRATAVPAPPLPTAMPSPGSTAAIYSNEALGFSVAYGDTTNAPFVEAYGIPDAILFPIDILAADIYRYAITVAAGDRERGVWLTRDGARVQAATLDELEMAVRQHVPGSSKADPIVVDGEPARIVHIPALTAKPGAPGDSGATLRPSPVPIVLVIHGSRPYVISWRDGFLSQPIDRRGRLLAFLGAFRFLDPPSATPSPGFVGSPSP